MLLAEDPRPLAQRLTHEAKRLLIAAAAIALLIGAVVVAVIVVAIVYVT